MEHQTRTSSITFLKGKQSLIFFFTKMEEITTLYTL